MRLFGALTCVVGSALAVFAISAGFLPKFQTHFNSKVESPRGIAYGAGAKDEPEIILINEKNFGGCLPGSGFGMCGGNGEEREKAESEFRKQHYEKAATLFENLVKSYPYDTRSQLGLGKTYVVLRKFDQAILPLSEVRNECDHMRRREGGTHVLATGTHDFSKPVEVIDLDGLPEEACDALDHEARIALETAVTGAMNPALPNCESTNEFKNDRHFQVLNASLKLAKQYHDRSQLKELQAMYQLAKENTRTLPPELITSCSTDEKDKVKRWKELARHSISGAVPQEKDWYLDRLAIETDKLPESDIRKAAVYHVLSKSHRSTINFSKFDTAKSIKELMDKDSPKNELLYANAAYDCGIRKFEDQYTFLDTKKFFLLAHDIYERCGAKADLADTNYNLGLLSYQNNQIAEAKRYFKSAAGIYPGKTRFELKELNAAFNFAILAVDHPEPGDEQYLINLYEETHHPEAATLLALHYLKNYEYEKAYAPLKFASKLKFPVPPPKSGEPVACASNSTKSTQSARVLSDQQVLETMFAREPVIDKFVYCRFAAKLLTTDGSQVLTSDAYPTFEHGVTTLFKTVLRKTNREEELKKYLKASNSGGYFKNMSEEEIYSAMIRQTLRDTWFCPGHSAPDEVIVHATITEKGTLQPDQLDMTYLTPDNGAVKASVAESINWTTLPPPPKAYLGKKVVVIFNATESTEPTMPSFNYMPLSAFNADTTQW